MATKSKRGQRRRPAGDLFQQAQRSLQKGRFKQALKDARVCYRRQPGEKTHRLLQQACLARARALCQSGQRDASRGVAESLLEIGVTESSVQQELPELLIALGLFDRVGSVSHTPTEGADSALLASLADHAVLRPKEAPASMPEIRQGSSVIRSALFALERGDESEASARLRDIARGSAFADWRFFVRGLAAYYRQDVAEMRANWDRLAPDRFAARIAAPLLALADPQGNGQGEPQLARAVGRLGTEVLSGTILTHLQELQAQVAAGRWEQAVRSLKRRRKAFDEFDPDLLQRVALAIYPSLVRQGLQQQLRELMTLMTPLPIDPQWNRTWAMVCEWSRDGDTEQLEAYWRRYIEDLRELPCLAAPLSGSGERTLAQGLVWLRLGRHFVEKSEESPSFFGPPEGPDTEQYVEDMRDRAIECLTQSIKLAPDLRSPYEALAKAHLEWEQPGEAAAVYGRLLEQFPEDLEALRLLAAEHQRRDEPLKAREYALRALRLKPLDPMIETLVWAAHVGSARHWALRKEWEKGRAELEAAEKINAHNVEPHHLLICKAALEFKAGEFGLGHSLVNRARNEADDPTPVLLYLTIQAIRYALPKVITADFEQQWTAALKKKCQSRGAGPMCKVLTAYIITGIEYTGRAEHVKDLLSYVRRCSRVKWQARDLCEVCEFLDTLSIQDESHHRRGHEHVEAPELLERFVRKGRKMFPLHAYFHYMAGELEMRKGPVDCNRRYACGCFERALKLAKDSDAVEDVGVFESTKLRLTQLGGATPGAPARFAGPPLPHFLDDEDEPFFESEDDEFGPDDDPFAGLPPRELFEVFARACRSMGVDPEEFRDDAAEEVPLPPRTGRTGTRTKRKKKKKN